MTEKSQLKRKKSIASGKLSFRTRILNLTKSKDFLYCSLFLIISLVLHLFHLHSLGENNPLFLALNPDSDIFYKLAKDIAGGNLIQNQPFFIGPLYGYFLALFFSLARENLLLIRYLQIMFSATVPIFTYIIALKTFNRPSAIISGFIVALYPVLVFFDVLLLPVGLEVFLIALALLLLIGFPEKMTWRYLFAGLALGLATLSRPNLIIFPAILLILTIIHRKPPHLLVRIKCFIPFLIGIIITILPVTIHNYYLSGELIPVSTHGGINFYVGNNPQATGAFHAPESLSATPLELNWEENKRIAEEEIGKELSPNQVSSYWFQKGLDFIRHNPQDFLNLLWRKVVLTSNYYELSLNDNFYFHRMESIFLRFPLNWGVIFAFGMVGIFVGLKRRGNSLILLALIITTIITLLVFIVNARYRICMLVPLAVFAGYLPVWLVERFKSRKFLTATIAVIALVGLLIADNITIFGLSPGVNFAPMYIRLGKYNYDNGNYEEAAHNLRLAVSLCPNDSDVNMLLGVTYIKLNEPDKAYQKLTKACSLAPNNPKPFYNLSLLLINYGRKEEALPYLEHCFQLAPEYLPASFIYMDLLISLQDLSTAKEVAMKLVEMDAQNKNLNYRLGYILFLEKEYESALQYVKKADDLYDAHRLLGEIYLQLNMPSEAMIEFEKERELYPENQLLYEPLNALLSK